MLYNLLVENIKCSGCANTISTRLSSIDGVNNVVVSSEKGMVSFEATTQEVKNQAIDKLIKLGYPLQGEGNSVQKIKSYVSCMIGKINS